MLEGLYEEAFVKRATCHIRVHFVETHDHLKRFKRCVGAKWHVFPRVVRL